MRENFMVRGLPEGLRKKLEKSAKQRNLSLNQVLIEWLTFCAQKMDEEAAKDRRRKEAFRRIRELREEFSQKYGKQEDSVKLLHEAREERDRQLMGED